LKRHFFETTAYLILANVFALAFWFFHIEAYGLIFYAVLVMTLLIAMKDTIYVYPLLLSGMFMIRDYSWESATVPIYMIIIAILFFVGMVIHLIRYKVKFWQGRMRWPLLLMIASAILTLVNTGISLLFLLNITVMLIYVGTYFFFRNTLGKSHIHYLMKAMMISGLLIASQVFIYYVTVDSFNDAILYGFLDLGWGSANIVATYFILFIPASFYYIRMQRNNFLYVLAAGFQILMLLLTLSRSGIITFIIEGIFLLIYVFSGTHWKETLRNIFIVIASIFIIVYLNLDVFYILFVHFQDVFFFGTTNIDVYQLAIARFLLHPLFGSGLTTLASENTPLFFYQNTILLTMASFGLVGLVALIWQFVAIYKLLNHQYKYQTVLLGLSILFANIQGIIDNVYYLPQFMIALFLMIALIEKSNVDFDEFLSRKGNYA